MAIPGYDPSDVEEFTLEREPARGDGRLSIVAASIPDTIELVDGVTDRRPDTLADPIELRGLEAVEGLDAVRIELDYDPTTLPAGSSPTDVAVAVDRGDGREILESEVDLEKTTVSTVLTDLPPGSTVFPVHTKRT